jgi:hypothetical protein
MASILQNWKTTAAGIAAILTAAGDALTQISTGHFSSSLDVDVMAVVAGIGLIFAKDHNNK